MSEDWTTTYPPVPHYAVAWEDAPGGYICPEGWLKTTDPNGDRRPLLIPVSAFRGAIDFLTGPTPPGLPPATVTILDCARMMVLKRRPDAAGAYAYHDDADPGSVANICAVIVAETDPPGQIVVGRQAAEGEPVPGGYAEARIRDTSERLFIAIATKPAVLAQCAAGELPTPVVEFTDAEPVEYEGRTYRALDGFAYPPVPLMRDAPSRVLETAQVRVLVEVGAPTLGEQPRIGFFPEPDQACPDGYTEVTDSEGKRAFLPADMVAAVAAGKEWTGAGPSIIDQLGPTLVTETMNQTAAAFEAMGIRTVNRSPQAMAAREQAERAERAADMDSAAAAVESFLAEAGEGEVLRAMLADLEETRDQRDALRETLEALAGHEPALTPPPDYVWQHPAYRDLAASLNRTRAELDQVKADRDRAYTERGIAQAAVAWLGMRFGVIRVGVAEGADPANPAWPLLYLDIPTMRHEMPQPERVGSHYSPSDADMLVGLPRDPGIIPDQWSKEDDTAAWRSFLDWLRSGPAEAFPSVSSAEPNIG